MRLNYTEGLRQALEIAKQSATAMDNSYIYMAEDDWENCTEIYNGVNIFHSSSVAILINTYERYMKGYLEITAPEFKDIIPIEPDIFERHNLLILAKKITFGIPNNFNLPLITSDRNFQKDEYDYLRKLTDSYTESRYSYKYSFSDFKAAYEYIEIKRKLIIDKLFPDKQIDNINDNLGIHEEDDYII